jgi:hypothetical protein
MARPKIGRSSTKASKTLCWLRMISAATTVRAWYGDPVTTAAVFSSSTLPLVGFGITEAADLEEAIRLVAPTPCARAKGFVEVRPIVAINM